MPSIVQNLQPFTGLHMSEKFSSETVNPDKTNKINNSTQSKYIKYGWLGHMSVIFTHRLWPLCDQVCEFEIGVTQPLYIYWMKTFSIYKQVFILTKWSYSDICTINTCQDIGKFRQLIVLLLNVDFLRRYQKETW